MNRDYNDLLGYFKNQQENFITLLKKLVSFQTYTGERENINQFLDFLEDLFSEFEPQVTRFATENGDVLSLSFFPEKEKTLILLAHTDTVKAGELPPPVKIKKDRFYANGCYDMKSGIALFYFTLKAFAVFNLKLDKQIRIVFNPDEETGSKESLPVLLKECDKALTVLLPEPSCPDGGVKTRRKGVASLKARLTGKAAHSGIEPEKGIDANRGLAKLIIKIEEITLGCGGVTFNPGFVKGGTASNVVSPGSFMEFEVRSYSNDSLNKVLGEIKKIENIAGVKCEIITGVIHPALEFDEKNKSIYEIAKKIAISMNYDLPAGASGGGSDGSFISAAGIPVIDGIGLKGGGAHSPGEFIYISDFPYRAALITALCMEV